MPNERLHLRPAVEADGPLLHQMICELADFERLRHKVESTPESIRCALFGDPSYAEAVVAEWEGKPAGFALFLHNFSTFTGKPGLYLEDLFVREPFRKNGIGKALLKYLARVARERDCGRFEWCVLDWNDNAIQFYESLGADVLTDWRVTRLSADGIRDLSDDDVK